MFATLIIIMASSAAPQPEDNVVRCVREPVTGSLSRTRRVCHTVGEWRKIRSDSNDEARRNIQSGTLNEYNGGTRPSPYVDANNLYPGETPR